MKLIDNASKVLRQAWSVRLGILAGLFSGAEVIVPLFADIRAGGNSTNIIFLRALARDARLLDKV